jgi:hypothetical protein
MGGAPSTGTGGSPASQGGSPPTATGGTAPSTGGAQASGGGSSGGAASGASGGTATGGIGATGGTSTGGTSTTGGAPASGGRASGGSAGAASGGTSAGSGGSATGGVAGGETGALTLSPNEGIYSYPRTTANGPTQKFQLKNGATSAATVNLALSGGTPGAFRITSPASPSNVMVPGGGSVEVSVQFVPNGTGVASAPAADSGGVALNALLSATGAGSAAAVQTKLFGLVMTIAGEGSGAEPTLGQILTTLGYSVDVGSGLRDHLANTTSTTLQGSEVALPRFVRAQAGSVTLRAVARFSPSGPMPYGYYTVAAPNCANQASNAANCHVVGSMLTNTDANTSNGSRMLNPPVDSAGQAGTFDPGSEAFGIWSYTDQASQKVSTGGTATNGDYAYTDNALNMPSSMHRVRVWPLRDRAGAALSNSYLIGVEEASNGDYQDYVFVITNVKAP